MIAIEAEEQARRTLLVVDDSPLNRAILEEILCGEYSIIEAHDGVEAVRALEADEGDISLVILDIVMPRMDGFEVLAKMNREGWIERTPVVTISAETSPSYIERAYELGVTDFITRPFDELVVRNRVANTIALYQKQHDLMRMVSREMYERERRNNLMVTILSQIVEFRNGESGLHVLHIGVMTDILLHELVRHTDTHPELTEAEISTIATASALHDIGKIAIPSEILNKPGRLTPEEYEVIKTHSAIGADMLKQLTENKDDRLLQVAEEICRWHHERYDGGGYPDGLVGDEIPIGAQVVALAGVYDALTSVRVYKPAFSHERALEMIANGECGAFNPVLLQCLLSAGDTIREQLKVESFSGMSRRELAGIIAEIEENDSLTKADKAEMIRDIHSMLDE
ncbi:HD-GYP domain-containing protein [Kribbibacterium absianum]|uniref:HD-GYP domain-containing protein n=1 Tax=Kribbibacterium absianum TaxID=3044210 RepID=UPI0024BBF65E|nr:HD domain-containing phosphohydrolase [Olsenella sp. YH-ols2216]MDJ1122650.1 response regulator [Olsenella sp. YH-ols2216]